MHGQRVFEGKVLARVVRGKRGSFMRESKERE